MKRSLDFMAFTMEVYYAPSDWKKAWHGWDLYYELSKAKDQIDENPKITLKDYHRIVRSFLASTRDYHVTVEFISTEEASLPIRIKGADSKFYLSYIDRFQLPQFVFPFNVGDEVVTFNGKPTLEEIKRLESDEIHLNLPHTDRRLAEYCLTHRIGAMGHEIPSGKVRLEILPQGKTKKVSAEMPWSVFEEEVKPPFKALARSLYNKPKKESFESRFPRLAKHKQFSFHHKKSFMSSKEGLGTRSSFLPALGKKVWETQNDHPFHAYIYINEKGKKIGYLRIPHYEPEFDEVERFKQVLSKFNQETEGLVLDQMNNPGGSVLYLYTLLSCLTDKPLDLPTQRALITQEDIIEALDLIGLIDFFLQYDIHPEIVSDFFEGYDVTPSVLVEIKKGFQTLVDEWNEERFLTDSFHLYGMKQIQPNGEVQYTKPILVLINELDFSCGDFLPAILQDNQRATLFGMPTAGAGGYVLSHSFANRLGVSRFNTTASIAFRKGGKWIENCGVEPDIRYEIKPQDLKGDYQEMKKAINQAL